MNLLDVLFPRWCMGCGSLGGYVCADCLGHLSVVERQKCPMCERASVSGLTHARCRVSYGIDGLVTGFRYSGLMRRMVKRFKFGLVTDLLDDLFNGWVSFVDLEPVVRHGPMLVTSVPLHASRLRYRGYNQAALLGNKLATYLGWDYAELLERTVETKPQSALSRAERGVNLDGVFACRQNVAIAGTAILIVDDIWTTGATMRACARMLKKAGARTVWGMTLAA